MSVCLLNFVLKAAVDGCYDLSEKELKERLPESSELKQDALLKAGGDLLGILRG